MAETFDAHRLAVVAEGLRRHGWEGYEEVVRLAADEIARLRAERDAAYARCKLEGLGHARWKKHFRARAAHGFDKVRRMLRRQGEVIRERTARAEDAERQLQASRDECWSKTQDIHALRTTRDLNGLAVERAHALLDAAPDGEESSQVALETRVGDLLANHARLREELERASKTAMVAIERGAELMQELEDTADAARIAVADRDRARADNARLAERVASLEPALARATDMLDAIDALLPHDRPNESERSVLDRVMSVLQSLYVAEASVIRLRAEPRMQAVSEAIDQAETAARRLLDAK